MRTEQTNKQNLFSKIQMSFNLPDPLAFSSFTLAGHLNCFCFSLPIFAEPPRHSALTPWSRLRNILSPSLQFFCSIPFCAMIFSHWQYAAPTPTVSTRIGHSVPYLKLFLRLWKDMNKIEVLLLLPLLIPWLPIVPSLSNSALKYLHLPSPWKPSLLLVSILFALKMRSVCLCLYALIYQTPSSFTSSWNPHLHIRRALLNYTAYHSVYL